MMFWLLALVLLASLAGIGFRQGAVRVAFSFVGILLGALLAGPLGKLIKPLLVALGVKTPPLAWLLAPLIGFVVISIIFKVAAQVVHKKVDVYFRYHTGDLRQVLWERLNRRVGLCLALANGALYLILLSGVIYPLSYWTVQMATEDKDPRTLRIINRLGHDLQNTGFAKVARAVDPMPQVWYDSADLAGVIYNNPLSEARLARYPALLGLAERSEFQDMAKDTQFTEMLLRHEPILTVLDHPRAQAVTQNPELARLIWSTVVPDLKDLSNYLVTDKSAKYDSEKILGRWNFDLSMTMNLFRRAKPTISRKELLQWKNWMASSFSKTSLVAMTDHQALLKNAPPLKLPTLATTTPSGLQTFKGEWKDLDNKYQLALATGSKEELLSATIDGDRMTVASELPLVFDRED
jgi:uncharacterized membrane protein YvlD (DUF360 family)